MLYKVHKKTSRTSTAQRRNRHRDRLSIRKDDLFDSYEHLKDRR